MSGDARRLATSGLTKRFGGVSALDDVGIAIDAGEIVALVGPNGAGKSTFVDVVTGFVKPDRGHAAVDGRRVTGRPWRRARDFGVRRTFQHPKLANNLTARENVSVGTIGPALGSVAGLGASVARPAARRPLLTAEARTSDVMGRLGLVARPVGSLSVGEWRLIDLGRALSVEPRVVFIDEPFAGADALGMERMARAVEALAASGCAVIVIDHHVDVLAAFATRMILMFEGRVLFDGLPSDGLQSREMRSIYFGERDA